MELRNAYLPRCLAHSKCSVMVLVEEITVVVESRGSALIGQKIELINLAPFIHSFMDCCTSVPMPDTADAKGTRTQAFVVVWDTDTMVDSYDTRLKVP